MRVSRLMVMWIPLVAGTLVLTAPSRASDPVGIYAMIDRVVYMPNAAEARMVQVWGAFAVSEGGPGDNYRKAERGYLLFSLNPSNEPAVRAEWADLRSVEDKGQIVGFGLKPLKGKALRVRCAAEKAENPDVYPLGVGVVRGIGPRYGNMMAEEIERSLTAATIPTARCP
jgi:hypothetical protein